VEPNIRHKLLLDDEALYSTTDQLTADKITKDILKFIPKSAVITDATACVGGNTYSFAQSFKKVFAFEKDTTRAKLLAHNMNMLGMENVHIQCGDAIELCPLQCQDIVFLDPPWGGPEYKRMDRVDLYLSDQSLWRFCEAISASTTYIAIKAPINFNELKFFQDTSHFMDLKHKNTQLRKMHFYIFKTRNSFQTVFEKN
jgi:16S rRNA G966 N2-methylase RsmD